MKKSPLNPKHNDWTYGFVVMLSLVVVTFVVWLGHHLKSENSKDRSLSSFSGPTVISEPDNQKRAGVAVVLPGATNLPNANLSDQKAIQNAIVAISGANTALAAAADTIEKQTDEIATLETALEDVEKQRDDALKNLSVSVEGHAAAPQRKSESGLRTEAKTSGAADHLPASRYQGRHAHFIFHPGKGTDAFGDERWDRGIK